MKQKIILDEIVDYLHSLYPYVPIGIGGSVAANVFNENSDVDILLLMENNANSFLVSFPYKGINISIMIFNKTLFYKNEHKYLFYYENMPVTYMAGAIMIYDDRHMIMDYRRFIGNLIERRIILKKLLIDDTKRKIMALLQCDFFSLIDKKMRLYKVVNEIITLFYLKQHPNKIISKKEAHNPFCIIMKEDYKLYIGLKKCLPYSSTSYKQLKDLVLNYILLNY